MRRRPQPRRGRAWLVAGLVACLLALSQALPAGAQPGRPEARLALVIGNAKYPTAALRNPANDARAMARTLRELGFEVMAFENLGQRDMRRAVRAFGEKLRDGGGVGLFFFAGHGIQLGGRNFLVPVDATGVRIELALRLLGGPTNRGFGLKFAIAGREQSDDALYFMLNGEGSFKLERYVKAWQPLIQWTREPGHVRSGLGQANDLAVELVGRTVRLFVNGQLVGTTTADRDPAGSVGLFLDAPGLEVAFASLKVLELPR